MPRAGADQDLWIFAYGSLMWRPDFAYAEQRRARVYGFHRALCIYSHHWRGTAERPGLVLGLDRGGSCVGLCFRIAREASAATLAAVRERELVTGVYEEIAAPVRLEHGERLSALTYVARRAHAQYAGGLPMAEQARLVRQGFGVAGSNLDYIRNTLCHLEEIGIRDARLDGLARTVASSAAGSGDPEQRPPGLGQHIEH